MKAKKQHKSGTLSGFRSYDAPVRSKRSFQKEKNKQETKARVVLGQLMIAFPDRAYRARKEERLLDWFIAATMEKIDGDLDREWLTVFAKQQIEAGVSVGYLHATARERIVAQIRESTLARSGFGEFGRTT